MLRNEMQNSKPDKREGERESSKLFGCETFSLPTYIFIHGDTLRCKLKSFNWGGTNQCSLLEEIIVTLQMKCKYIRHSLKLILNLKSELCRGERKSGLISALAFSTLQIKLADVKWRFSYFSSPSFSSGGLTESETKYQGNQIFTHHKVSKLRSSKAERIYRVSASF